jgi:hypothetical protein
VLNKTWIFIRKIQLTSNSSDRAASRTRADLVAFGGEGPESIGVVNVGVDDRSGELLVVNVAKVKGARGTVLESHSEQRLVEIVLDGVEEGCLRSGADGVDGAESQTQEAIIALVLHELLADLLSSLNGLASGLDSANDDGVLVNITTGTAAITV